MKTLVTGARGKVATSIIRSLHAAGHPVRAATKAVTGLAVPAGVQAAELDLSNPAAFSSVFDGVGGVFLYPQPDGISDLLKVAEAAGVARIVLLSSAWVLKPDAETAPVGRPNVLVERALDGSRIASTSLRPDAFASNALSWAGFIRNDRAVPLPYPDAQVAAIHPDDIADIAVEALTGSTLTGRSVTLTGAEPQSFRQQLAVIGEVLGRDIEVQQITRAQAEEQMSAHMPARLAANLLDEWAAATSQPAAMGDTTQTLLGKPARSFAQWARENRGAFMA